MHKIRVVIAEGRTLFRQGLAALLRAESDFEIVGEAANADEARRVCIRVQPQLIVLDAALADGSGPGRLNVIPGLRVGCPQANIVVIEEVGGAPTEAEEKTISLDRRRALQCGAAAYLRDTVDQSELLRVLRRAAQSNEGEPSHSLQEGERDGADWSGETGIPSQEPVWQGRCPVTERERAILALIAQGLCNKEVAHRLGIRTQTVKNHVSHLLEKLNLSDRTQLAVYVLEHHLQM